MAKPYKVKSNDYTYSYIWLNGREMRFGVNLLQLCKSKRLNIRL